VKFSIVLVSAFSYYLRQLMGVCVV